MLEDAAKIIPREKSVVLSICLRKEERSQIMTSASTLQK